MLNRFRRVRLKDLVSGLLVSTLLLGCAYLRKPAGPIPVRVIPAPQQSARPPLVVVLPGRSDDLDDLAGSGIAAAVQRAWPTADVMLTGATLGYYLDGDVAAQLHADVIEPARRKGYREIWLAGASMGGMGALLYDREFPHDVAGLVLMAPFMGKPSLIREVAAAGGPGAWDPGSVPAHVGPDNYQREMWRRVKDWGTDPRQADRVWLVCGEEDRFIDAARLMAPMLAKDHYLEGAGGHEWPVWDAGAEQAFTRIAARRSAASVPGD